MWTRRSERTGLVSDGLVTTMVRLDATPVGLDATTIGLDATAVGL